MPIHEYECRDCRLKFEIIDLGGEDEPATCPRCRSENVEKKVSLFSSSCGDGFSCGFSGGFG